MLNKQENQQAIDYSETEKQHRVRQEYYIPLNNQERNIPSRNGLSQFYKNTGFASKTLWDILQLIGGATFLGLVGLWISYSFQNNQVQIAAERYQQTALDNYFNQMTDILIDKKLGSLYHLITDTDNPSIHTDNQQSNNLDSIPHLINVVQRLEEKVITTKDKDNIVEILTDVNNSQFKELEAIARAQTLTTLNLLRLDEKRRDLLLNFLRETNLVAKDRRCIDNSDKDKEKYCEKQERQANLLIGINLNSLNLPEIKLDLFILKKADFGNANLSKAFLSEADFSSSILNGSNLRQASMKNTNLYEANLKDANLTNADLTKANLTKANLTNANLTNANLTNANLTDATLTKQAFSPKSDAIKIRDEKDFPPDIYLCRTTLPNKISSNRDCLRTWKKWPLVREGDDLVYDFSTLKQ
ncbi:pentapeptide repeat-containing protein [Nostoc sp. UIC 10607]|uniref:pentapeptide repeat-containing protein n=1 Tax=Nostoc sp. UIC 10607 TaxID=3045935 RepID=UPI0039A25D6F